MLVNSSSLLSSHYRPIPVAAQSKASVCRHSLGLWLRITQEAQVYYLLWVWCVDR